MTTPARQDRSGKKPSPHADFYSSTALSAHNALEKLFGNFDANRSGNIIPTLTAASQSVKAIREAKQRQNQILLHLGALHVFNQTYNAFPSVPAAPESATNPGLIARLTDTGTDFARAAAGVASFAGIAVKAAREAFAVFEERHASPAVQWRPENM